MTREQAVKIIKRREYQYQEPETAGVMKATDGVNIWSTAVQLWVRQYRQSRSESLPAFDRLFKDPAPQLQAPGPGSQARL